MIYNLDLLGIGDAIIQALRTFSGRISAIIYELIDNLYTVFIYISKAEILDSDFVKQIYTKVGMILGIFMVFKLTFSLIQALIEPDKLSDERKGFASVIKRSVIAIVLLGITPSIFREAFKIQNFIVGSENSDNIIYKLIAGTNVSGNFEDMGRSISSNLYFSFFRDDEYPYLNNGAISNYGSNDRFPVDNYDNLVTNVQEKKIINEHEIGFDDTVDYLSIKFGNVYCIEYNEIFSIAFGLVVVWIFISYCIQVGTRVIQLAYLQLIAPIPILSYISDPDGSFKKWINQCVTTYLDLFIRLAIIYFVMMEISDILKQFNKASGIIFDSTGLDANDKGMLILVKIFIILGLLMFAKKVPDLLKDLFPNMGGGVASLGFGLKSPKKLLNDIPIVGGTANKAIGWTGKKMGQGAKFVGKKATSPITNRYNHWKDDRKSASEIKAMEKPGKDLFDKAKRNGELSIFKNEEFKNSYQSKKTAKQALENAEATLEAAKASGASEASIRKYVDARNKAQKAYNDAEKWHDNNRKRYGDDARREDNYKLYKSMHPEVDNSQQNISKTPSPVSQPTRTTMANGNTVTPAGIEVVENNRPQQPSRTERERQTARSNTQDEHAQLVEKYNNATDPTERDRIRREIDDFEKRH